MTSHAILATVTEQPGMLHAITKVLADHAADIKYVDIHGGDPLSEIYLEFTLPDDGAAAVLDDLRQVTGVASVAETPTFGRIYGKRIIVMGGGAQVGHGRDGGDCRGRPPQHPRRAHLGRHDSAGRRARARGGGPRRRAAASRQAAGAGRIDHGRRDHRSRSTKSAATDCRSSR